MKKNLIASMVIGSMMMTSAVFAHPNVGDVVNPAEVHPYMSDGVCYLFLEKDDVYRCSTKDNRVMEIDYRSIGASMYGNSVGDYFKEVSDNSVDPIANWKYKDTVYRTYKNDLGNVVRYAISNDGKVKEITIFMSGL